MTDPELVPLTALRQMRRSIISPAIAKKIESLPPTEADALRAAVAATVNTALDAGRVDELATFLDDADALVAAVVERAVRSIEAATDALEGALRNLHDNAHALGLTNAEVVADERQLRERAREQIAAAVGRFEAELSALETWADSAPKQWIASSYDVDPNVELVAHQRLSSCDSVTDLERLLEEISLSSDAVGKLVLLRLLRGEVRIGTNEAPATFQGFDAAGAIKLAQAFEDALSPPEVKIARQVPQLAKSARLTFGLAASRLTALRDVRDNAKPDERPTPALRGSGASI